MKNINYLQEGDRVKVFDYGNDVFDENVTIISIDTFSNEIVYETDNYEKFVFSGQGYFEEDD